MSDELRRRNLVTVDLALYEDGVALALGTNADAMKKFGIDPDTVKEKAKPLCEYLKETVINYTDEEAEKFASDVMKMLKSYKDKATSQIREDKPEMDEDSINNLVDLITKLLD